MDYMTSFIGARSPLPTKRWGLLTVETQTFSPAIDGDLVVEVGNPSSGQELLLRIHSQCLFSEVFGSTHCDCAEQLEIAMDRLVHEGAGILIYLRFEGRGAGLAAKVRATQLELQGVDTYTSRRQIGVEPESRNFEAIGAYLAARGFSRVRALTNNPAKASGLESAGLKVVCDSLLVPNPSHQVKALYRTKATKFGHLIPRELLD
jgi:GTP cyclohydrolase II